MEPLTGTVTVIPPTRDEIRKRVCDAVMEFNFKLSLLGITTKAFVVDHESLDLLRSVTKWDSPLVPSMSSLQAVGSHVTICGIPVFDEYIVDRHASQEPKKRVVIVPKDISADAANSLYGDHYNVDWRYEA